MHLPLPLSPITGLDSLPVRYYHSYKTISTLINLLARSAGEEGWSARAEDGNVLLRNEPAGKENYYGHCHTT